MSQITDDKARAAVRDWILQLHAELDRSSYYHLLQVPEDAYEGQIRAAYYALVARLHPDLYVETLDADTRAKLISIYSRLVEAYRVLADGARREQYDKGLREGRLRQGAPGEERKPARPTGAPPTIKTENAKRFFKLGQESLRAGNPKAALQSFKFALSQEPDSEVIKAEVERTEKLIKGT